MKGSSDNTKKLNLIGALGSLESRIMDALWERGESSGREIYDSVKRGHDRAYTTVLTVLDRLVKKGHVDKKKSSKVFTYTPVHDEKEFIAKVCKKMVQDLIHLSSEMAIINFVDVLSEKNDAKFIEMQKLIDHRVRKMEKD